ncbi:hypothetical protein GF1_21370 [Desulfolithobacter dissulfuricans]|uniref:Tetratricopeptide repeat protein n=1 Tax=Desulfolithobacter dissulfuricans TaxID=2795293 RepID=A0A915XLG7_9BACT|nr:tetratricopeptide repeat protein [Desulfolithobacter dissulfuricans]BCO09761.1 hypothetical protein GF1_21370 [Desulfolithobacter dissulfuricans]
MSRKKKRKKKKQGSTIGKLSPDELKRRGQGYLESGKFRQAIEFFRQALKKERQHKDQDELRRLLARAYHGRIEEFSADRMYKEALALLENMESFCGRDAAVKTRLLLDIRSGRYAQAARLFATLDENKLEAGQRQRLEELFGALLLFSGQLGEDDFAAGSPVLRHYPEAKKAVAAYLAGQADILHTALRKIPFRSPYRDLRLLLSGCIRWHDNQDEAFRILRRIRQDSPYYPYVAGLLSRYDDPVEFFKEFARADSRQKEQLANRYGLQKHQQHFFEQLAKPDIAPYPLYQLVKKHKALFTPAEHRQVLLALAPFCHSRAVSLVDNFPGLDLLEKVRLLALAAEIELLPDIACEYWYDYLGQLDRHGVEVDPLVRALVLRHLAQLLEKIGEPEDQYVRLDMLRKSLEYDPADHETWIEAYRLAYRIGEEKKGYRIINDAVEQLPDNVPILLEAMRRAGQRNAHRKAARLAARVLKIDPINTDAMDFMAQSHLAHARKLAGKKKFDLADRELDAITFRVRSIRLKGRNLICRGMLLLLQKDRKGLDLIEQGRQENPSMLLSHVLVSLEGRLMGVPVKYRRDFDRALRQAAKNAVDTGEFLRLMKWIVSSPADEWQALRDVVATLKKYVSTCAGMDWQRDEGRMIGKALDMAGLHVALARFGRGMRKRYPDAPEWRAYELIGLVQGGNRRKLQSLTLDDIDELFEQLFHAGQHELIQRVSDLLPEQVAWNLFAQDDELFPYDEMIEEDENEVFPLPWSAVTEDVDDDEPHEKPQWHQMNLFDDLE